LYVILNKNDYNNLSIIDKTYFTKIDNDILFDKYIFCNFIGEDFQFKTIVLENNIHSIVLNTYLSKSSYSELYKDSIIIDNFERKKLNYSFFEVLIASFLNLQPKFDEEYLLVAKDNPEEYIKTIIQLNEFLKINKLLLNINLVSPSLSDLFIASMNDVIQKAIDYDGLSRETQLVRDDLDDWVRKHLLNLQANPPKGFLSYLDESTHTYVERPWQTLVIAGDGGFALRAASRQNALEKSASDLAQLTKLPGIHQVRPYMDAKLSQYLESSAAARSAASHSSIATKVTTGLSTAVLAYDVATSDEPTKEAVSGGAAMYLGAAAGTFVGGLVTVASESPQAGVVAGTATSVVTENIAKSIIKVTYDQIPLEYRERIDNTLWHLPYYIGFDW